MPDTATLPIRMLGNKIAVVRDEPLERTKAGIILPENSKDKPSKGEVVAIGDGHLCTSLRGKSREDEMHCHREPLQVKVGDKVVFARYAGVDLPSEDKSITVTVMSEDDILAIVTE